MTCVLCLCLATQKVNDIDFCAAHAPRERIRRILQLAYTQAPDELVRRMKQAEADIRDLRREQRDDLARLACVALDVGNLKELLLRQGNDVTAEVGALMHRMDLTVHRVDLNVSCIRKLNVVASRIGEGKTVA